MRKFMKRNNPKLQPPNVYKVAGKLILCDDCHEYVVTAHGLRTSGTLKKCEDGKYRHYPACPNKPSEEMKKKLEELKNERNRR